MMATRFELELSGDSESELRAIGEAALNEISDVERRLSFYLPSSELSRINREATNGPVALAPDIFELIDLVRDIYNRTDGAFDPTIGPLMSCWAMHGREQADLVRPSQEQIDQAFEPSIPGPQGRSFLIAHTDQPLQPLHLAGLAPESITTSVIRIPLIEEGVNADSPAQPGAQP